MQSKYFVLALLIFFTLSFVPQSAHAKDCNDHDLTCFEMLACGMYKHLTQEDCPDGCRCSYSIGFNGVGSCITAVEINCGDEEGEIFDVPLDDEPVEPKEILVVP